MQKRLTIQNFITVLLIIVTIPMGEVSQYLPHYDDANFYPLFPLSNEKIQYAWYYFFIMRCINWVLIMIAVKRIASFTIPVFYRTCRLYLFYRVADLAAFMLFKSAAQWYAFVYVAVAFYAIYEYLQYRNDEKTINGR